MAPIFHMVASGPTPVGPFSHAVEVDGWIFVTGQMPTDPENDSAELPESIEAQTQRVLDNLNLVLEGLRLSMSDVVSARVFLTHFEKDYEAMNAVYASYFASGRLPSRTCIGVTALAKRARVEIDLIARRNRE